MRGHASGQQTRCWVSPEGRYFDNKAEIESYLGRVLGDDDDDSTRDDQLPFEQWPSWLPTDWTVSCRKSGGHRRISYTCPAGQRTCLSREQVVQNVHLSRLTSEGAAMSNGERVAAASSAASGAMPQRSAPGHHPNAPRDTARPEVGHMKRTVRDLNQKKRRSRLPAEFPNDLLGVAQLLHQQATTAATDTRKVKMLVGKAMEAVGVLVRVKHSPRYS